MSELIKLQVLRMSLYQKEVSNTGFSCEFCESSQNTYFVEDLWTAGSETPAHLYTNTFFYRTSPVAASDSFRFPACIFIKKETPGKMFFCEYLFKNIFWQNISGWLLLVFICGFWEFFQITSFIELLLPSQHKDVVKTSYFWCQRRLRLVWSGSHDGLFIRRCQDVFLATSWRRLPGDVLKTSSRRHRQDLFQEMSSRPLPGDVLKTSKTSSRPFLVKAKDHLETIYGFSIHVLY